MNIEIRLGTEKDSDALEQMYDAINDYLECTTNYPGWRKGVYPTRQDAVEGINEGRLFVAIENKQIVGSMILRHKPEPAYEGAPWQVVLEESEVLVIYTFVVSPKCLQHGVGRKMLEFAEQYAVNKQVKALRLDVYEKNLPAIRLYEKIGYRYIDTVSLGLEEYGLDWFRLYEKIVK
ncbi:MAG: GNAT family N-acetyltransferase [Cellulosilyticaceae bacterium]